MVLSSVFQVFQTPARGIFDPTDGCWVVPVLGCCL